MMTDPMAEMLTRMRNALRIHAASCTVPGSRLKVAVLDVLKREGYIRDYQVQSDGPRSVIQIALKYGPNGEQVITRLTRFSTPGCRRFRPLGKLPTVRGGLGISIVSSDRGVLSDRECRERKVGGEVLCTVE